MVREVALALTDVLAPHPLALAVAVLADVAAGDPVYAAHPVRLMGRTLQATEGWLLRRGADGYAGGVALFVVLSAVWVGGLSAAILFARSIHLWLAWGAHLFLLYTFLALGDLLHHGWRVERALRRGDLTGARRAIADLVGRDTERMDEGACRRAAIESLSENLTDGFTSALFWYVVAGLPGLVLFKVASTMDSMVGYKTPRYLRFGWCGARADDVMNIVPARLTWLLVAATAAVLPGCSGAKALRVGYAQHAILPGPNSGWSEAATAGAIQRKLVGPIWMHERQVTDVWLGDVADPPVETAQDFSRATTLVVATAALAAIVACLVLARVG